MLKKQQLKHIHQHQSDKKRLEKECKELWQRLVKLRADYKCEFPYCRKSEKYGDKIDAHHFFTKGGYSHLRFDPDNGIALCFQHHTGGREGAHSDPLWTDKFMGRIAGYKPARTELWLQKLTLKANTRTKLDLKLEKLYLKQELKKYEKN